MEDLLLNLVEIPVENQDIKNQDVKKYDMKNQDMKNRIGNINNTCSIQ